MRSNIRTAVLRFILILAGGGLMLESVLVYMLGSMHLGVVMPFVIGLPLITVGVFWRPLGKLLEKSKFCRFLKWCMIAVYVGFFLLFGVTTSLILINSAEPADSKPDKVIVLGAGIRGNVPTATLSYRLEKALEVYENDNSVTLIVSGGMGSDEAYTEAEVMRNWLVRRGVPEESIITEDRSESTEENFLFSRELIEKLPGEHEIAFITNRFHVFRAERIAAKLGLETYGIPTRDYKPFILNDYMRECAALVQYFLTGRI